MPLSKATFQAPVLTQVTSTVTAAEAIIDAALAKGLSTGIAIPVMTAALLPLVEAKLLADYQAVGWSTLTVTKPSSTVLQVSLS